MTCEADQVELVALSSRFGVNLLVAYVDGTPAPLVLHPFFERGGPVEAQNVDVALLYRPGHYDLLYYS